MSFGSTALKYGRRRSCWTWSRRALAEVETLKKEFEGVRVICNHRVADEEMWTRSLSVGADDCCPSSDTRGILSSRCATINWRGIWLHKKTILPDKRRLRAPFAFCA